MAFLPKLVSSLICPALVYDDCMVSWDVDQYN